MGNGKGISAVRIIGLIFSLLGGLFLVLGLGLLYALRGTEAWLVGMIFTIVGSTFFAIGVVFLVLNANARKKTQRLMETGRYVWGEIVALEPDRTIRINNRNPFYAVIRYTDSYGMVTMFQSRSSMDLWHRHDLKGRQVKVYVGQEMSRDYSVDMTSLLR